MIDITLKENIFDNSYVSSFAETHCTSLIHCQILYFFIYYELKELCQSF